MSVPYTYFANLDKEVPEIPADSILSRTLYQDEELKVILFAFAAGQELSEHTSARPAALHFLRGEADLILGGEARPAGPGTWVHMAPRLPHSILAKTPLVMLLLMF